MIETPTLDMECELASRGYDLVAGFDEVGRGALAGPVMVGCAMVWSRDLLARADVADVHGSQTSDAIRAAHPLAVPDGVADSKLLTEHRREAIFDGHCGLARIGQGRESVTVGCMRTARRRAGACRCHFGRSL